MGFKRPEVQIFSPRPGRRGRLSVRGDFFFTLLSSKIPALTPAIRSSLSAQCPLRSFTLPLQTSARPRSLTTFRGRAPRVDDPRDGRASAAIFYSLRSSKIPALTPAVRSSLSAQCPLRSFTLQLRTYAFPRSLTTFRGRAPRDVARGTVERPRRFFFTLRSPKSPPRRSSSAPPFPRNVRFAPSTLPLRTSARPRSLTTFRGRACIKSEALPSI